MEAALRPVAQLEPVIGGERYARLVRAAYQFRQRLAGRTVWNVSSTAVGGGVAEMLQVLVGYVQGLDIPIRWRVITGDAEFFVITKRLHNQIHGEAAGGPSAGPTPAITRGRSPRTLSSGSARYGREISCCCTARRPLV